MKILIASLYLMALACPHGVHAQSAQTSDPIPKLQSETYTLPNGLQVILHQDNSVPIVVTDVWYHVGSGDEVLGKSGFAHLFEHMLFQGSKHVGEDKHFEILRQIGASNVNGSTNTDRTNYFEMVPSNQLETALWLESDRMGYLLPLLNQKSLSNQIDVVRNERRQNYDNVPFRKSLFAQNAALYPEGHPYRYLTIGKHEDLEGAKLDDVIAFYKKWYVPANATLVIAGDFEPQQAKALVTKWFGQFPLSIKPVRKPVAMPKISSSRVEVKDRLAKLRKIEWSWHTPATMTPGDAEFDLLSLILSREGTGRLYKRLVLEEKLAQSVSAFQNSRQWSSYFSIAVTLKTGADAARVEAIVEEELDKVRKSPVGDQELARAKAAMESSYIWGLESLLARAENLHSCNHFVGKTDCIADDLARYRKATVQSVLAQIGLFLRKDAQVVITTTPDSAAQSNTEVSKDGGKQS